MKEWLRGEVCTNREYMYCMFFYLIKHKTVVKELPHVDVIGSYTLFDYFMFSCY